jgi:hypothetical protein
MAEEITGEKPEKKCVMGKEKPDPETSEVGGRQRQVLSTCWSDGTPNWTDGWHAFNCWRCGALNYN